jgi:hypothetical protein
VKPPFENRRHSDIVEEVFDLFKEQIKVPRIKATKAILKTTCWRGTAFQFLRELAWLNDRHVYILPGEEPGASIGCFLPDPEDTPDLPPLVMIGDNRSLANATITEEPDGAEITQARVLRTDDQGITIFETSAADLGLMRELPAVPVDLTPRRLLPPWDNTAEDPEAAVTARARRSGYTYRLSGEVVPGCYGAVLTPYLKVRVDAGKTPYSGEYLITQVIHRITPSLYTQRLEAKADSLTEVSGAQVAEALGGGLKLSVSSSVEIF